MLQRQGWHIRKQCSLSSIWCVLRCPRSLYTLVGIAESSQRSLSSSSIYSHVIPHSGTSTVYPLVRSRDVYLIEAGTSQRRHSSTNTSHDPLINLDSLSDSLDAHRKANRDGIARDGVLVKPKRGSAYKQKKKEEERQQRGRWAGMNVLHIASTHVSRSSKSQYRGLCPPLLSEWRCTESLPDRLRFPWTSRLSEQPNDACVEASSERLSAEIQACERYFSPSLSESRAASAAFAQIREIVLQCLDPQTSVDLLGSRAAGNEGPVSDFDINIKVGLGEDDNHQMVVHRAQLDTIDLHMRSRCFANIVLPHAYIRSAKVPIVVGTHIPSGLDFQIQSTFSAYDSLEVSRAFTAEYPAAPALFKLLKQMLTMRGLNSGAMGGITSYPLLNMIVTSLKLAGTQTDAQDISSHFLNFLDFWSEFNFETHKIVLTAPKLSNNSIHRVVDAVDPISSVPRVVPKSSVPTSKTFMMSLQDPADATNDLGKNTHGIKHVQACFIEARESIRRNMQIWETGASEHAANQDPMPILAWCLGGDYTSFEEARLQLKRYSKLAAADITS